MRNELEKPMNPNPFSSLIFFFDLFITFRWNKIQWTCFGTYCPALFRLVRLFQNNNRDIISLEEFVCHPFGDEGFDAYKIGDLGYFKSTYSKRGCQERCRRKSRCNAFTYDGKGFSSPIWYGSYNMSHIIWLIFKMAV